MRLKRIVWPVAAVLVAGLALATCSPPALLDGLNSLTPGDAGVQRVAEGVRYGDAPRQALDVWAGSPRETGKPVLVFFYGGGWAKGARADYGFAAKAFAARGFVVVVPDYRLVPSVRFPSFVEDGAAAVRWTHDNIARFGGDPERTTLAGHSAGAYIAVMLALDTGYLRRAGVDPGVVRAAAGLAGPYDFYPFDKPRSIAAMGQAPDPAATQPITFARADAPPLFLATGTEDTVVRPKNARNLAARLKRLGAPVTLREYQGLNHEDLAMALSKPFRSKGPVLAESADFLMRSAPPGAADRKGRRRTLRRPTHAPG